MDRKIFKAIFFILTIVVLPPGLWAAYQENLPQRVVQPNGSELNLFATGDEFFSYLHDANGYTIIKGEDGYYYYAIRESEKIVASPYRVDQHDPAILGLEKRVTISAEAYRKRVEEFFVPVDKSAKAPQTGNMVNLVIYIRFSDDAEFTTQRRVFDDYFNKPQGPSVRHYFQEVSYGKLDIESHHYPVSEMNVNLSYQSPYPRSYFRPKSTTNPNGYDPDIPISNASNVNGRTFREQSLLAAAVFAVIPQIAADMLLDADGDGRVDNVSFIIRGQQDGWNNLLWAHRWVLWSQQVYIHGKRVYDYTFQPESQSSIYVLCHEMFHVLGAPDLYRYNDTGFTPVGPWDLMHSGFVHMGAYMKWKYAGQHWISEIPVIDQPGTYWLNPLTSPQNNAFRINTPNSSDEYFVLEYRKRSGHYENNIPGEGLLIYRINKNAGGGNANGPPDEVHLFRLDGGPEFNGNIFQAHLSQQAGRTNFSDQSNPKAFLFNQLPPEIFVTNISGAGQTISFDILSVTNDLPAPSNLKAELNDNFEVILSWDKPETTGVEGRPGISGVMVYRSSALIATISGKEATSHVDRTPDRGEPSYFVRAIYENGLISPPSQPASVSVPAFLLVDGETFFELDNASGSISLQVRSNISWWSVNAAQTWAQPFPASGSYSRGLVLNYLANHTGNPRSNTVAVSGGGQTVNITLRQGYTVSVEGPDNDGMIVYPNPSRIGYVMVSLPENVFKGTLRVIDLTGRTLISKVIDAHPQQTIKLSTSSLLSGIYLIEVSSPHGLLREKVVLHR